MRVIAIANFHPPGLPRPIRPGETLDAEDDLAHAWIEQRLAIRADEEQAVVAPAEAAVTTPPEKAVRKPRENAARRKR